MNKIAVVFCLMLMAPFVSKAQVSPKDGALLNYTIIGFRFPEKAKCKYVLEIARGTHFIADSFTKHIIVKQPARTNKQIAEVPWFARDYTWRVVYTDTAKRITAGELHHFSTFDFKGVDTTKNRLRIIDKATKYKDAYVFIEANRALYDMNGHPVWFLPGIDGVNSDYTMSVDLQLSPLGTITFMYENLAGYEVDYNGKILFRTPHEGIVSGDTAEHPHHEFCRLKNGHYMMMGSEVVNWDKSFAAANDSTSLYFPNDGRKLNPDGAYQQIPFGTLVEYDHDGKIVWSWKSSKYLKGSDLYYRKGRGGFTDINSRANSFYYDEKGKAVYVGFQSISRIVKIKYPEGNVLKEYGEILKPGMTEMGNGLFCRQQGCKMNSQGNLYLYDTHSCTESSFPSVIVISPQTDKNGKMKKLWEYICPIEGETGKTQTTYQFTFGGNVVELPDHSYFTSMSTFYSRVLIVSPEKKLLWSGIPERWNRETKQWEHVMQFKANIITSRKDLEKLIWNAEEKL